MTKLPTTRVQTPQEGLDARLKVQEELLGLTHRISLRTTEEIEFINITEQVREVVLRSGVRDGAVFVQSLHTTSAVFINEWQEALLHDFRRLLEHLAPNDIAWRHNDPKYSDCERGNATSHLRAALLGPCATVPICSGKLALGVWQQVIFAEFDGPRERSVLVRLVGSIEGQEGRWRANTVATPDSFGSDREQE